MSLLLLGITVLAWGLSWYAMRLQVGPVAVEVSIAYRFLLATALLGLGLWLSGRWRPVPWRTHGVLASLGLCLFGLNYLCMYHATSLVTSGVASVVFTTATLFGAFNQWLFFARRPEAAVMAGALLGTTGIVGLFYESVVELRGDGVVVGLALALVGTYVFSLGNVLSVHISRSVDLPNAVVRAMAWGALGCGGVALLRGQAWTLPLEFTYLAALGYLVVIGSVVAFLAYLNLVNRMGAAKAAYATVLFPVVALTVSTLAGEYRWTTVAFTGLALILLGSALVFVPGLRRGQVSLPKAP
ncbi:MAG: DMT family transporter [Candidatus Competibacterales bacterium]